MRAGFLRRCYENSCVTHACWKHTFYRTLLAALISQATNLGVVSMSASVQGLTVDMLRRVLQEFIREDTLTAANAEIVNHHHALPLSAIHGAGTLSSSDAQRFGIRASSLLASYYPRYYGYYEKAIGIYTHISDQSAVFGTQVISCSPREALYVLDGLLANNTILQIREHTTDIHGYTVILTPVGYTLMQGRGEQGRWSPTSPDETLHPRLGSRRSLPTLLP
jgi:hypothetical protein